VLLDQDVGAGDLSRRHLVPEEFSDLRELLLVEMRARRHIERASGTPRRCLHQHAAGQHAQYF